MKYVRIMWHNMSLYVMCENRSYYPIETCKFPDIVPILFNHIEKSSRYITSRYITYDEFEILSVMCS